MPQKGAKYIKNNNRDTRTMSVTSFWCVYCYLWTYFTSFSIVSMFTLYPVYIKVHADWTIFHHVFANIPSCFREYSTMFSRIISQFPQSRKLKGKLKQPILTTMLHCKIWAEILYHMNKVFRHLHNQQTATYFDVIF